MKRMSARNRRRLADYLKREAMKQDTRGNFAQATELRRKAESILRRRAA